MCVCENDLLQLDSRLHAWPKLNMSTINQYDLEHHLHSQAQQCSSCSDDVALYIHPCNC